MKPKLIVVRIAESRERLEEDGCAIEHVCETVKQAKSLARYYLTSEYFKLAELSQPLRFAMVLVDGVSVAEFDES